MSALQTVLKLLPELKPEELKEVRNRIDFLCVAAPELSSKKEDWLLEGIVSELSRRGLLSSRLRVETLIPKGYIQQAPAVRAWLAGAMGRDLTSTEKLVLGRKVGRALADYLYNVPGFGLRVMLQQVDKVPQAMDSSFPGYVAAGMLGKIVRMRGEVDVGSG